MLGLVAPTDKIVPCRIVSRNIILHALTGNLGKASPWELSPYGEKFITELS